MGLLMREASKQKTYLEEFLLAESTLVTVLEIIMINCLSILTGSNEYDQQCQPQIYLISVEIANSTQSMQIGNWRNEIPNA